MYLDSSEAGPTSPLRRKLQRLTDRFCTGADLLLGSFGIHRSRTDDTVTEDDVKELIEQGTEDGTFEKSEQAMVDRIFHLSDQTVSAIMTPRTQMLWLDLDDPLRTNLRLIRENPQDIFPVGRESLDDYCGILHAKDLLDALLGEKLASPSRKRDVEPAAAGQKTNDAGGNDVPDLAAYVKKPLFVPRSMETFRVLAKFRDTNIHEAMVLDEYGGVIGYVTLADIIEEIIGDGFMSTAEEPLQITPRDENSWFVDGLYSIEDFKERFGIEALPDEDHDQYHTVGGFLTSYFGYIPKVAEKKTWKAFTFEVVDMDRARIDKILVVKDPDYQETEEEE